MIDWSTATLILDLSRSQPLPRPIGSMAKIKAHQNSFQDAPRAPIIILKAAKYLPKERGKKGKTSMAEDGLPCLTASVAQLSTASRSHLHLIWVHPCDNP